ncbi:transcriptional regulator [Bacillus rhizoplanae]|uniref:transcriptional regulator n=1 Tax=Bacillus rhizoplanae TaxID=2880966 RepID=UPI003D25C586
MQKKRLDLFLYRIFVYISAFYGFLWLHPFFTWNNSLITFFGGVHALVFLLWIIAADFKISKFNMFSAFFALFLIIMFSFKDEHVIRNLLLYSASLIPLILIRNEDRLNIYDKFIKVVALSLLPAIIIAIILLMGVDLQWSPLLSTSWTKPYYRNYFNLSIYTAYGGVSQQSFLPWGGSVDRICGMFDEPGVVGTISGLILISKGFSLKRIYEKIIFIAGIFSFSFAFFFMVFLYFLIKNVKYSIPIFVAFVIMMQTVPQDSYFYSKILHRFEITSDGIQGNNRTNEGFDNLYSDFLKNDNVLLGIKEEEFLYRAQYYGSEALSWKTFVVINGLLLFIFHTLYFLGYTITLRDKRVWIFCMFYFFSIYQRPYDFSLGYWLIFFGGILTFANIFTLKVENSVKNTIKENKFS